MAAEGEPAGRQRGGHAATGGHGPGTKPVVQRLGAQGIELMST